MREFVKRRPKEFIALLDYIDVIPTFGIKIEPDQQYEDRYFVTTPHVDETAVILPHTPPEYLGETSNKYISLWE